MKAERILQEISGYNINNIDDHNLIIEAMNEYAKEAFEAGRKFGREEGLYDYGVSKAYECTAPDFEEWLKEQEEK